ncbi:MAG TPA: glycosyltransferase [Solirubrobacteraceae bacterium]|nr:glycosyltransferase [Solirubrobacteraceae bacterium]
MRIGYLATHYPAVSHTFIQREVAALRRIGVEVETFSIHRASAGELLSAEDRAEARRTCTVLPTLGGRLAIAHLSALLRGPRRYVATLAFALRRANPGVRGRLWGLFYFAEAIVVWRAAARRRVRHLHAIFADGASDVALIAARYAGDGWSFSLAIHGPVEFYDVVRNHLAEKIAAARFTVAISDFGRSQLMTLADERRWGDIHVVRCGLDPGSFVPVKGGLEPGARGAAPASGPPGETRAPGEAHILCVGRLVHLKGQSLLIEACARLIERGEPVRLTLVGDGPTRARLEDLSRRLGIAQRVVLAGAVGQDRIRDFYASADIFCLPSLAEGLPVVLMEAMALRVPVVTTRIMGIPELVEDEQTGLLVAPGRVDELTSALSRLAHDPDLRRSLADRAAARVRAEHDVNASARRLQVILAGSLRA